MRMLLGGVAVSVGLYLLLLAAVYLFQRQLVYFPDQTPATASQLRDNGFEAISVAVDGVGELQSYWRAAPDEGAPVLILFHGNGGSSALRLPLYALLAESGLGVLASEYPGYGGNPGSPTEDTLFASAQSHYDWLVAQGIDPSRIVIVGQSLGSAIATKLASDNDAALLILEAPFTAADDIGARQMPILPVRLLMRDRYRSIDRIAEIDMPLLWIHGTQDEIIPFAMGQQLFYAARKPKRAEPIVGGMHNDLWVRGIDAIIADAAKKAVAAR